MANQLEQLRDLSVVVADTGEIEKIKQYKPVDATTNPSLLLKVAGIDEYKSFVTDAVDFGLKNGKNDAEVIALAMDRLFVTVGKEISKIVPGVVSTEVDARLSFDTEATIEKARSLITMYKDLGVDKDKVLIKIASTWEGIKAAEVLEKEGIHCNMTLLFNLVQAVACAEAEATLISPFVGRITDWYKKNEGVDGYAAKDDPGVKSVTNIYNYFKKFGHKTIVMAASFRNQGQVLHLAGCDKLTLAPDRLAELEASTDKVEKFLDAEAKHDGIERIAADEKSFRWALNEDAMATEKLAEGIRNFAADARKLEDKMREIIKSKQ